jgi:TatA/E family protein of Tat protein translocase
VTGWPERSVTVTYASTRLTAEAYCRGEAAPAAQAVQAAAIEATMPIMGIGLPEMLVILAILLLVFGANRLPELGRSLGKAIRGFKDATKDHSSSS